MTRFQLAKLSEEKPLFLNPDSATKLLWAAILGKAIQFPTVSRWTIVPPLPWPLSLQGRRSTKTLKNSRIYKTSSHQPSPGSLRSPRYISFQIFCLIYFNSLWNEVFPTTTASSYESRAPMRQVRIREDIRWKNSLTFGHLPKLATTKKTHPPIRAAWSSFFRTSKQRFTRMTYQWW